MNTNKDIGIQEKIKQYPGMEEKINTAISNIAKNWKEYYNEGLIETLYESITEHINQCIDVDDQKDIATKLVNDLISRYEVDASDGYHTFGELYKHRIHLFIALCHLGYLCINDEYGDLAEICTIKDLIKSKKHFDGSEYEGWFIIQLETSVGQISYHLPNEYWDRCEFIETVDKANEWDGHTSNDVLNRLLLI